MMNKIKNSSNYYIVKDIISILIPLGFAIFNGVFGLLKESIYNGAICVYYILLLLVRALLVFLLHKETSEKKIRRGYLISFVMILLLNLALIAPSILLLLNMKEVNVNIIVAISMATYTTYSISISIYNLKKYKHNTNILVKQLKMVSFINAIVSVMVLQNTLIVVNGGYSKSLEILSIVSTIVFIIILNVLTIYEFIKNH